MAALTAKQLIIKKYAEKYELHILVETGTLYGDTIDAMKDLFDQIYSIELDDVLYNDARKRFAPFTHIEIIHGDSGEELCALLERIDSPVLFWLDGHYSGGDTARGKTDTPILAELSCIFSAADLGHVILIDDAYCFGAYFAYPNITELTAFIKSKRTNTDIVVENNIIQVIRTKKII